MNSIKSSSKIRNKMTKLTFTKMWHLTKRSKGMQSPSESYSGKIWTLSRRSLPSTHALRLSKKITLRKRLIWHRLTFWDSVKKKIWKGPNSLCSKSSKKSTTKTPRALTSKCFPAFWNTCASFCTSRKKCPHTFQWATFCGRKFLRKWLWARIWSWTMRKTSKPKFGRKRCVTIRKLSCQR